MLNNGWAVKGRCRPAPDFVSSLLRCLPMLSVAASDFE